MCSWSYAAKVLLIIGGLNWGLVGAGMLFSFGESWNVVNMLLGSMPAVLGVVYLLVGVAALVKIFGCRCKTCSSGVCMNCVDKDQTGNTV